MLRHHLISTASYNEETLSANNTKETQQDTIEMTNTLEIVQDDTVESQVEEPTLPDGVVEKQILSEEGELEESKLKSPPLDSS